MLEDEDFEAQQPPSPQASPAFRRLRKGPRPQVTAPSAPEGVEQPTAPDAAPTGSPSESEAKAA